MARHSDIEWCHHTFNPWWGCHKVSPECTHCYAETFSNWLRPGHCGHRAPRSMQSDAVWAEPLRWNAAAKRKGRRERVFCGSMCDVFEELGPGHPQRFDLEQARERLWDLIEQTPKLDWLLLTKRPEHVTEHAPFSRGRVVLPNVWLGTTAGVQASVAERLPHLLRAPAVVRFVSAEPLLERVTLRGWLDGARALDWVIAGGESGRKARPSSPAWFEGLRAECEDAGVPFFFKQWGAWCPPMLLPPARRKLHQGRVELDGHELVKTGRKADAADPKLKHGTWQTFRAFPKQSRLFAA